MKRKKYWLKNIYITIPLIFLLIILISCDNIVEPVEGPTIPKGATNSSSINNVSPSLVTTIDNYSVNGAPGWEWQNPLPQGYYLNDIWGISPSNVFAVGIGGTVLNYDGIEWRIMQSSTLNTLTCVWGNSATDIFAIGYEGTIVHFDGISWKTMNSGTTYYLNSIWGSSSSNIFAVGDRGIILHYNGEKWSTMVKPVERPTIPEGATPTSPANTVVSDIDLNSVWGSSPSDVYAVGDYGLILHFDGITWNKVAGGIKNYKEGGLTTTTDPSIPVITFTKVWGTSFSDVFVMGGSELENFWHYDGEIWEKTKINEVSAFTSIWSNSSGIFATGEFMDGSEYKGLVLRYYDGKWNVLTTTDGYISGAWGISASDIFVVSSNIIKHYNGESWEIMSTGTGDIYLVDIWGSSSANVLAVGSHVIMRYDGNKWITSVDDNDIVFWGVWGSSSSDFFVIGNANRNGVILHYDGNSWQTTNSINNKFLNSIWGSSSSDVFIVGNNGTIIHYNGSEWVNMDSNSSANLGAVWGTSSSDVFAVGEKGTILHYSGSKWTSMDSGYGLDLTAIWGSSPSDVFVVGYRGVILHYDGVVWKMVRGETPDCKFSWLADLWGSSSCDIFTVGDHGIIQHYDGQTWKNMYGEGGGNFLPFTSIWGDSSSDVFIVGQDGLIWHYSGN